MSKWKWSTFQVHLPMVIKYFRDSVLTKVGNPFAVLTLAMILLCGFAGQLAAQSEPTKHDTQPQHGASAPTTSQPAAGTTTKPSATESMEPRPEPSASEILKELQKDTSSMPKVVVRPARPGKNERQVLSPTILAPNAIVPVEARLLPDGTRLVDRPGRLTREGDYYTFSFESRSQGAPEAPMRLLPNRLLEDMEVVSEGGAKSIIFLLSGEVTEYHGVNYLLVQKLLVRPDLGNLK